MSFTMTSKIKVEIVCESPNEVALASQYDIDRIELSSSLHDFGLTPTLGSLKLSLEETKVPIVCSIRHRTGGYVYSDSEFELSLLDGKLLLEAGASGLVFGFLTENFEIDVEKTKQITKLCHSYGKEAIFHRAFDSVKDQLESFKILENLKVDRVITAGGLERAIDGKDNLKALINRNSVTVLAGGGITPDNVKALIEATGAQEIHSSCKQYIEDKGHHPTVQQAVSSPQQVGKLRTINPQEVEALVKAVKG